MKKILLVAMIAVLGTLSVWSKPKAKNAKAAVKGFHAEYTDWQGAAVGAEIPEWVKVVASAATEDELRALLKKPKGYRVWAIIAQGEDLDSLKMLTDNFDIQAQVGASISQNVAQIAEREMEEEGGTASGQITDQKAKLVTMVNQNLTLNGLERVTSYWTKYYMADKKGRPVAGDSGKERYVYIVVMGMDGKRFDSQLDAAMKKIEENSGEDEYLRKLSSAVMTKLKFPELMEVSSGGY